MNEIMTTSEICQELGCGRKRLYLFIKEEGFPASRIGRSYKALRNDVLAWIAERARKEAKVAQVIGS